MKVYISKDLFIDSSEVEEKIKKARELKEELDSDRERILSYRSSIQSIKEQLRHTDQKIDDIAGSGHVSEVEKKRGVGMLKENKPKFQAELDRFIKDEKEMTAEFRGKLKDYRKLATEVENYCKNYLVISAEIIDNPVDLQTDDDEI